MVLFSEASTEQIGIMKNCLNAFCSMSGQRVNYSKSSIFFSPHIEDSRADMLAELAGIPRVKNMGRYLGVHSVHGRVSPSIYTPIIDAIQGRLEGWKSKILSQAGRVVLARSVLSSIPIYTMQTNLLPKCVCRKIEQIIRGFIWKGLHLVRWEKVTKAENEGGLGIRSVRQMNLAILAKLGWRLLENGEGIWVEIIKDKYMDSRLGLDMFKKRQKSSHIWKGIVEASDILRKGRMVRIRNGTNTRFWLDVWCGHDVLINSATQEVHLQMINDKVRDYWDNERGWKWSILENYISKATYDSLKAIVLFREDGTEDSWCWGLEETGSFSVKSAYFSFHEESAHKDSDWQLIWKLKIPNRICHFLWLVKHRAIMTNMERIRRCLTRNDLCPQCNQYSEDLDHLFRFCSRTRRVWNMVLPEVNSIRADLNFDQWLSINLRNNSRVSEGGSRNSRFAVALWGIWKWRNEILFINKDRSDFSKAEWIHNLCSDDVAAFKKDSFMQKGLSSFNLNSIKWTKPPSGWFKLNSDCCYSGKNSVAGYGGTIRNGEGEWVIGYNGSCGVCSIFSAEAWGVLKGIQLAANIGIQNLIVESDSKDIIECLNNVSTRDNWEQNIICECIDRAKLFNSIEFIHIFREGNQVADRMAKHFTENVMIYQRPPEFLHSVLQNDLEGAIRYRLV